MKRARKLPKIYDKKKTGKLVAVDTKRKQQDAKRKPTFITAGDRGNTDVSTVLTGSEESHDDGEILTCVCQEKQEDMIEDEEEDYEGSLCLDITARFIFISLSLTCFLIAIQFVEVV